MIIIRFEKVPHTYHHHHHHHHKNKVCTVYICIIYVYVDIMTVRNKNMDGSIQVYEGFCVLCATCKSLERNLVNESLRDIERYWEILRDIKRFLWMVKEESCQCVQIYRGFLNVLDIQLFVMVFKKTLLKFFEVLGIPRKLWGCWR